MKRSAIACLLVVAFSVSAHAATLDGFWGFSWGTTRAEVTKQMRKKPGVGRSYDAHDGALVFYAPFEDVTPSARVGFSFQDGVGLLEGRVWIEEKDTVASWKIYQNLKGALIQEWGKPVVDDKTPLVWVTSKWLVGNDSLITLRFDRPGVYLEYLKHSPGVPDKELAPSLPEGFLPSSVSTPRGFELLQCSVVHRYGQPYVTLRVRNASGHEDPILVAEVKFFDSDGYQLGYKSASIEHFDNDALWKVEIPVVAFENAASYRLSIK